MLSVGGAVSGIGIIASSFVSSAKYLFITYCLMTSTGLSFLFFSSYLLLPLYFKRRLVLATGVTSAGSSVGCFVFSPLINLLIMKLGLRRALRYYSLLSLIPIVGGILIRRKIPTDQLKKNISDYFDRKLFRNRAYLVFTLSMSVILCVYYVPYVYLVSRN